MDTKMLLRRVVSEAAPDDENEQREETTEEVPEGLIACAEDIMDVLSSYSGGPVSENASKVEKAAQEAARRAKAKMLAQALSAFWQQVDVDE